MRNIGYLGPEGTFTHTALEKHSRTYAQKFTLIPHSTPNKLFNALNDETCDMIFIPIENSLGGEVVTSLDCLVDLESHFTITAEVEMHINQCLMARQKIENIELITDIFSHEQSLHQSQKFLQTHCPEATLHFCSSNAQAATIVSEANFEFQDTQTHVMACIGNKTCAELYKLNVIQEEINDNKTNQTRFILIGKKPPPPTGKDKTSFTFSAKQDQAGSLSDILNVLSNHHINMTRITSRPTKNKLGEYLFFIDCDGHQQDPLLKDILSTIEKKSSWYKFLGSYKRFSC